MTICPIIDPNNPPATPIAPAIRFLGGKPWLLDAYKKGDVSKATVENTPESAQLVIPWQDFEKAARVAPGGNKYWSGLVDFNATTLKNNTNGVRSALWLAAQMCKKHFANNFGPGKEHGGMLMKDVLTKYKGFLEPTLGILSVEVPIKPTEKAADYVKRGGYLFWIKGWTSHGGGGATGEGGGVFGRYTSDDKLTQGTVPIQSSKPEWAPDSVEKFDLYLAYDWKKGRLKYIVRLLYKGNWDQAVNKIGDAFEWVKNSFCKTVTNQALTAGAAYAATNPVGAAAYASWQLAAAMCGARMPTCEIPPQPTLPPGSVAYFDKKQGGYLIAVPLGLGGLEPTHTATGQVVAAIPPGVTVVDKVGWENATMTWYRRTWVQGVAAGVVLLGGAAVVVSRRRSAA